MTPCDALQRLCGRPGRPCRCEHAFSLQGFFCGEGCWRFVAAPARLPEALAARVSMQSFISAHQWVQLRRDAPPSRDQARQLPAWRRSSSSSRRSAAQQGAPRVATPRRPTVRRSRLDGHRSTALVVVHALRLEAHRCSISAASLFNRPCQPQSGKGRAGGGKEAEGLRKLA